jgi:hypothetical protein
MRVPLSSKNGSGKFEMGMRPLNAGKLVGTGQLAPVFSFPYASGNIPPTSPPSVPPPSTAPEEPLDDPEDPLDADPLDDPDPLDDVDPPLDPDAPDDPEGPLELPLPDEPPAASPPASREPDEAPPELLSSPGPEAPPEQADRRAMPETAHRSERNTDVFIEHSFADRRLQLLRPDGVRKVATVSERFCNRYGMRVSDARCVT